MKKIVLASDSPRRKDLLCTLGVDFEIVSPAFEKKIHGEIFSFELVEEAASSKAHSVLALIKTHSLVIGADTVVVFNNKIMGKPSDKEEAVKMLLLLNNDTHKVVTSLYIIDTETKKNLTTSTLSKVTFNKLSLKQIHNYVQNFNPLDKAGAYGIQELPVEFVKSIEGCKNNIIGLPCDTLKDMLDYFSEIKPHPQ